jgi:hypothetical protein
VAFVDLNDELGRGWMFHCLPQLALAEHNGLARISQGLPASSFYYLVGAQQK